MITDYLIEAEFLALTIAMPFFLRLVFRLSTNMWNLAELLPEIGPVPKIAAVSLVVVFSLLGSALTVMAFLGTFEELRTQSVPA